MRAMFDNTDYSPLPNDPLDRVQLLQSIVIGCATSSQDPRWWAYDELRRGFMADAVTRALLPDFVRQGRDLTQVRVHCQTVGGYKERRSYVWDTFAPLFDHFEERDRVPLDDVAGLVLASFDADGVHAVWTRALARRQDNAEGAVTLARTLLETVCKRVLDEEGLAYGEAEDLPALYGKVARQLNLAPSQHTEEAFRRILGACHTVVETIGTLRNKIGDAHGRGGKPVRPASRHAALAVNLAGTMATFIVETWQARKSTTPVGYRTSD